MATVGERIRARRDALGWTLEDLAKATGMSKGFLSDLENNNTSVGAENLLIIARALSVSLDHLMKGDDPSTSSGKVQIPASLSLLAKDQNLTFAQTLMLLDMRRQIIAHRSATQTDDLEKYDWKIFYEAVKGFLK